MALLVVAAAIFAAGFLYNKVDDRRDLRAHAAATVDGDPSRGEAMFIDYGCGSCHRLSHVRKASGMVGPTLDGIAERAIVAGKLNNSPENLQRWIRDPQAVTPGTAMPDLNVGARDARDISAFLYTRTG
ncbi:c-type cytochrome [Sphingomonas sp. URHD0057]|uniref:c-type cytochrome n=1 Tax=Sphingomonas sp. URHD0057 TaxID=1380389 RepID=UPI000491AA99|nr:c-type cytochrome [Sphingomonas sp. URHD0057]